MKRLKKNEKKEKVAFLVKWLLIMFSILNVALHLVFIFVDQPQSDNYSVHFDIRYYYWYLVLAILSVFVTLYGTWKEDYLWLWSAGTMIFIVLFLGITGEASYLLLGTLSSLMLAAFVFGKMVRYRPREHPTEINI